MVINHYGSGHITKAAEIGTGLAFCISMKTNIRMRIKPALKSILDQGGKVYKDQSSFEYDSWFLTMPKGEARIAVL